MIEFIPKLTGILKLQALPLFLMTMFRTDNKYFSERKELIHDEDAPGDNFPYIVMKGHNLS